MRLDSSDAYRTRQSMQTELARRTHSKRSGSERQTRVASRAYLAFPLRSRFQIWHTRASRCPIFPWIRTDTWSMCPCCQYYRMMSFGAWRPHISARCRKIQSILERFFCQDSRGDCLSVKTCTLGLLKAKRSYWHVAEVSYRIRIHKLFKWLFVLLEWTLIKI
jgi:hypothetical protein